MSSQLDILALEPFYGGIRRAMLEAMIRCSRHRWTLLKLPPRRMERRLTTAAHWFAEQISRHWSGHVDLVFTSEAMNLADLYRRVPSLERKPSVVYFHSNQLPDVSVRQDTPADWVNVNTASAATEIWFNSLYHYNTFVDRLSAFVDRHPEFSRGDPVVAITNKAQLMYPPMDMTLVNAAARGVGPGRDRRTIFADTRDADAGLLSRALLQALRHGEPFRLVTVGPVEGLDPELPRLTLGENDEISHAQAMAHAGIVLSTKMEATCDHHVIRSIAAGCWPVLPEKGFYPEILPEDLAVSCLYDGTTADLLKQLRSAAHLEQAPRHDAIKSMLRQYDPISACRAIDERLEEIVLSDSVSRSLG